MRNYPTQIRLKEDETETEKIFWFSGLEVFFSMIRLEPRRSFTTIGGMLLILALMFGLIFTFGLAQDPIATLNSQPTLSAVAKAAAN